MIAVASLLVLHLTWASPSVSQRLGPGTVRILSALVFWSAVAGLLASAIGYGRLRFVGVASCLLASAWWLSLSMGAAISMGAPIARHPVRFLIPDGYVGWVEIKYGENSSPSLPIENGAIICRFPLNGLLQTSSRQEEGWASDEYVYYSADGRTRTLPNTGWGKGGMVWAPTYETDGTVNSVGIQRGASFMYIGTEQQYRRSVAAGTERRPANEALAAGGH